MLTPYCFSETNKKKAYKPNREKLVAKLLKNRFEMRLPNGKRNLVTTLMCATMINNIKMAKLLLQLEANPNEQDYYGQTALMYSVDHTMTKLLLNYDADPNITCENGNTPLIIAISEKNIKSIKLLLRHGANPYLKNNNGLHAFDITRQLPDDMYVKDTIFNLLDKYSQ